MTKIVHLENLQFSLPAQVALFFIFVPDKAFLCALPGFLLFYSNCKIKWEAVEPLKLHAALQISPHSRSQMSKGAY